MELKEGGEREREGERGRESETNKDKKHLLNLTNGVATTTQGHEMFRLKTERELFSRLCPMMHLADRPTREHSIVLECSECLIHSVCVSSVSPPGSSGSVCILRCSHRARSKTVA